MFSSELNVNSAIARPDHHETLDVTRAELEASSDEPSQTYTLRGYAYSGGGRRVTRCEISLDEGASWQLSKMWVLRLLFTRGDPLTTRT